MYEGGDEPAEGEEEGMMKPAAADAEGIDTLP